MISAGSAALALAATFAVLCAPVRGKVYDRCELAGELASRLGVPIPATATWVCIAYHESRFDTTAIGRLNSDASLDHGLFQISDIYWCSNTPEGGKACNLPCTALRDEDLTDDLACALQIHEEHTRLSGDGFNAWTVYHLYCNGNVKKYVAGCYEKEFPGNKVNYYTDSGFDNSDNNVTTVDLSDNLIYKKTSSAPTTRPFTTLFDIDKLLPITTSKYLPMVLSTRDEEKVVKKSTTRSYFETTTVKPETTKKEKKITTTISVTTTTKPPTTTTTTTTAKPITTTTAKPTTTTTRPTKTTARPTTTTTKPTTTTTKPTTTTTKPTTTRKPFTYSYTLPTLSTKPFIFKPIFNLSTFKPYSVSTTSKFTTSPFKFTSTTKPTTTITTLKPTYATYTTTKKSFFTTTSKPTTSRLTTSKFTTTRPTTTKPTTTRPTTVSTTRPTTTTFKPFTTTKKYLFSSTTEGPLSKFTKSRVIHIQIFPLPTSAPDNSKTSSFLTPLTAKSFSWSTKPFPPISFSSQFKPTRESYKFTTTTKKTTPVTKSAYGSTFKWPSIFDKSEPIQKSVFSYGAGLKLLQVKNNSFSSLVKTTTDKSKSETQSQGPLSTQTTHSAFRFH